MACIGIDASRIRPTARTGTETYSLHLIQHLIPLAAARGHQLRLYTGAELHPTWFGYNAWPSHVQVRTIRVPRLWTHIGLAQTLWREPPDVLFIPAHVIPLWPPPALPIAVTVHDLGYEYFPHAHPRRQRWYLQWSTRHNVRRAQHIFVDSRATAEDLQRWYGASPDRISVVYPGLPSTVAFTSTTEQILQVRHRYGLTRPYLLFVGTLHPRKNLLRLLNAFARVHHVPVITEAPQPLPPPLLVLAGKPGWLSDPILQRAREDDLRERVRLLGYVPDADLPPLLQGALALVYPSLHEGFGFPVVEAQALGVPVLTSNRSSLPEVAGDGALLVDPTDEESLARALERLITDPALRRRLVQQGYQNVQRFSWERAATQVLDILETLSPPKVAVPSPKPGTCRSALPSVTILGVKVHRLTFEEALATTQHVLQSGRRGYIVTVNPEIIMHAHRNPGYRAILNRALMAWPDGIGVLWASRILGHPVPERVTGSDGVPRLAEMAARHGWRVYLLGAAPGVAQKAAQVLTEQYPGLQIVGAEAGDPSPAFDREQVARINAARADILFVAYGAPKQEWWIARNWSWLEVRVAMGVGGALDFIAGTQKRAPRWLQQLGLEWLWRLIREPWRWRRQRVLPLFVWYVLCQWWEERTRQDI